MGNGNNSNTHPNVTYGDSLDGEKDRALNAISDNRAADSIHILTATLPNEVIEFEISKYIFFLIQYVFIVNNSSSASVVPKSPA